MGLLIRGLKIIDQKNSEASTWKTFRMLPDSFASTPCEKSSQFFPVPKYTDTNSWSILWHKKIGVLFTGMFSAGKLEESRSKRPCPTCAPIIVQIPWLAITWMPSLVINFMARKGSGTNKLSLAGASHLQSIATLWSSFSRENPAILKAHLLITEHQLAKDFPTQKNGETTFLPLSHVHFLLVTRKVVALTIYNFCNIWVFP